MPASPADATYDIAVLGAGPAGLAAAAAAGRGGAHVVLLDGGPRVGGQFWRHRQGDSGRGHRHWSTVERLRAAVPDFRPGQAVWHVERTGNGFTVHTATNTLACRKMIIATGAYDRQLPFPGWTLPGVFTAGGAQALLKGHGVTAGRRVVVAGTGPFLLPVATGLAHAGAQVVGVFEAGAPTAFARHPRVLAANPGKLAEGAWYAAALARHRIPFRTRHAVIAADGEGEVEAVTVARVDSQWRIVPGSARRIACDTLAVGYGFTPQLEIPLQLGCAAELGLDGSLIACADERQRSSVPGVYLAGEVCGVGGAELSLVEGELAGLHAAGVTPDRRLVRRRATLRAFAAALHATYPVQSGWQEWLAEDTQVCRCEEVSAGAIRRTITELGASDPRSVKLLARPGMGLCQGRVCGHAVACLTGEPTAAALQGIATRPIAQPVTLGSLAPHPTLEEK
ncbi:FAD/NAD(P)-binding oxidoreductase [Saccharomonospora sp. NPDC046836]|uniref:FAD/NAD(P)-dependent oxidoreductase n=1 Tax=Saccharomonospora sp. NPDC046836 TaxID=3156921 RepID=UPI0033F42FCA